MVNTARLRDNFIELVKIDSVSTEEKKISQRIQLILKELEADSIYVDNSQADTGSDTGNLIAKFHGNIDAPPMILSGHMDTVEPGRGIKPQFEGGIFTSDGTTILGADDKSAIAIIIEVLTVLKENKIDHCPIEIVFTVCEEIGLLGAKNFDIGNISSKFGYILDSTDSHGIVTKAPFANNFVIKVHGKAAHAGAEPEKGVSAIQIAAKAISKLELGRIDFETTCNIGIVESGKAINIVPDLAVIKGEVRSHNKEKLDAVIEKIIDIFENEVSQFNSKSDGAVSDIDIKTEEDFHGTNIPDDHMVVKLAQKASDNLGRPLKTVTIGGGADANVFFGKGIVTGVLGTGMQKLHTTEESISLSDMKGAAELLLEIIRSYSVSYKESN